VDRVAGVPTAFDAAADGRFALNSPPVPWIDLGWCSGFARKSASTITPLRAGSPRVTQSQARTELEATVHLEFQSWGKLQLALASGSQQMNLLVPVAGATGGAGPVMAVPLAQTGAASTATLLNIGAGASARFEVGDLVAVDVDYTGQTGFVGSGVSAAWVRAGADVGNDAQYVRRVTLNVGRVIEIANGILQLGEALPAGVPPSSMQVSKLAGFVDREGGSFFQEWSGLFCMEGEQGDRVLYYYPRLQAMQGSMETGEVLAGPLERLRLLAGFRALPVKDTSDGETVLCFRSYLPAPMRAV